MLENLTIRPAGISDLKVLSGFLAQLFSLEKEFISNTENYENGLMKIICGGRGEVFVAEINGKPVGMASAQIAVSTSAGGISLLVEDVFISEEYREKGIGSALMENIKSWGKRLGAVRMQLVADRNNETAIKFYLKLGWKKSNMAAMYYQL
jgi:GNAT superfamily N-acetyltransferase